MFGLTRREQRWKAEQEAFATLAGLVATTVKAAAQIRVADAQAEAQAEARAESSELESLRAEVAELRALLKGQEASK